jgi:translocator protein
MVFALGPVAAAAGVGSWGARRARETYAQLEKPPWAPPASVFGPVWSALYAGIAAAGWRIAAQPSKPAKALHLAQLAFNGAWPVVFFWGRDKRASLAVIGLLDAALLAEVVSLSKPDPVTAGLLLPYLSWATFATALNVAVSAPGQAKS